MKPGEAPALLYDGGLSPLFRLDFSPDGTHLAMPVAGEDGLTINILTADGATVSSFHSPTLGCGAPTWTPDGKEVIYFDKDAARTISASISPIPPGAGWPRRCSGGASFYHGGDAPMRRRPTSRDTGRSTSSRKPGNRQISLRAGTRRRRFWAMTLLVPDFNAADGPRILAQPLAGGPDRVLAYAPGAQAQQNGLAKQDGGQSQDRRDHLCRGGAERHQYRPPDLGETLTKAGQGSAVARTGRNR